MERDLSRVVENTVPFDIWKLRKVKPDFLVEWNAPLASHTSWFFETFAFWNTLISPNWHIVSHFIFAACYVLDTYCSRQFNFATFFKLQNSRLAIISCYNIYLAATSMRRPRPVGTHIQYLNGYVPPNTSCFWSSWLITEYPFYRCFLYWGTIFRTHRATVS